MTPAETNIVKSLIAVAWADGQMETSEASVVEGLLVGFDATEAEEQALLDWAATQRTLERDVPVQELGQEDKELLLSNAALLTLADGEQTPDEVAALNRLVQLLGFDQKTAKQIIEGARDGALRLSSRALSE